MSNPKMQWTRPQLVVLARGTPEESVLLQCKTMNPNQPFQGPADIIQQDTCAMGELGNCSNCSARGVSGS